MTWPRQVQTRGSEDMIGCVKEGTEARGIGEVGVIGLSDALQEEPKLGSHM